VLQCPFSDIDRARTDRREEGRIKVITAPRGVILGAAIVGADAGELIQPWVLAVSARLKISAMANYIAPYPTLGEINKRVAGAYYTPALFSARTRAIVRFLARFG
jgi:pyruvate/2-oxoglutarate dehydrogenase complex dihydrolipoamide dehydrogenase (E3) component